jgi:hypothetical protein
VSKGNTTASKARRLILYFSYLFSTNSRRIGAGLWKQFVGINGHLRLYMFEYAEGKKTGAFPLKPPLEIAVLPNSQLRSSFPWTVHRHSATEVVCCQWRQEVTSPTPKAVMKYILLQHTACQVSKNTPPRYLSIGSTPVQATVLQLIDRWSCTCCKPSSFARSNWHKNIFLRSIIQMCTVQCSYF